jgi:NitT/TauT family transport system substrate-binding protein
MESELRFHGFSRRDFLAGASAIGAAGCLGVPGIAAAEPPPETTRFRIAHDGQICYAPQLVAEGLLRLEGFATVEYVKVPPTDTYPSIVAAGGADLALFSPPSAVTAIDTGMPILMVAGVHFGCWELFGNERVRAVRDLKGKTIAVVGMGAVDQLWIASIIAYVGIDPKTEVSWVSTGKLSESMRLFIEGKADAFLGFPPQPQELRAKKVGNVIVNITLDRPWSLYFCCMASMPREFVDKHPVATKRALRALLKAADICASEPERAARYLAEKGYEPRYEVGLEVLKSLPYNRWRDSNPEDTLRFHALRLHEMGMIKSDAQKIVAQGTDWRFLNELKKELKA